MYSSQIMVFWCLGVLVGEYLGKTATYSDSQPGVRVRRDLHPRRLERSISSIHILPAPSLLSLQPITTTSPFRVGTSLQQHLGFRLCMTPLPSTPDRYTLTTTSLYERRSSVFIIPPRPSLVLYHSYRYNDPRQLLQ